MKLIHFLLVVSVAILFVLFAFVMTFILFAGVAIFTWLTFMSNIISAISDDITTRFFNSKGVL